jgi:alanine racemase
MHRRTLAQIDLAAIRDNFAIAAALAPAAANIAVIKADAYGHGMLPVAKALQGLAEAFAVATVDEALQLRDAGIGESVLVLEGATTVASCRLAKASNLTLMLHTAEQLAAVVESQVAAWVKVDTGMHRLGLPPEDLAGVLDTLRTAGVEVQAVCTHLACADDPDNAATQRQLDAFSACTRDVDLPKSIANSAGILAWPASHADWNRPGFMLYGASPFATEMAAARPLRPAMSFLAEIIAVRDIGAGESVGYGGRWTAKQPATIATVAAGYADGYPRHAVNGTPVHLHGKSAPLVGTVSMDMITIDVTHIESAAVGDRVELWGSNLPINTVAASAGTIGYELMTGVTRRVPRVYN